MKLRKKFLALIFALTLTFSTASFAFATMAHVGGELNKSGSLVQYSRIRTHSFNGPITLSVYDMPSGYLRLGLRNMKVPGGPQFTNSIQWNHNGSRSWDNIRSGTRFAFQGRMQPCFWFCDTNWGGDLTF